MVKFLNDEFLIRLIDSRWKEAVIIFHVSYQRTHVETRPVDSMF